MKNSKDKLTRMLGKTNAPAYIIQTAITTAKSLQSLCCGEITVNEFFLEIGKSGTSMIASARRLPVRPAGSRRQERRRRP